MKTKYYQRYKLLPIDHYYLRKSRRSRFYRKRFFLCTCTALIALSILIICSFMLHIVLPSSASLGFEVQTPSQRFAPTPLSSITNDAWKQHTLTLLEKTHLWSGSYDGNFTLATGPLDPYTTYYALLTYQALGYAVPNVNKTAQALQRLQGQDGHFSCESPAGNKDVSSVDQMGCIFHLTLSLENLGSSPRDIGSIIRNVNSLEASNGLYASNTDMLGKMNKDPRDPQYTTYFTATIEALTVLHWLGVPPEKKALLQYWLLSRWQQNTPVSTNALEQVDYSASIALALHALGDPIPFMATQTAWIENTCHSVVDLSNQPTVSSKETNLFLIMDCVNLEQLALEPVQSPQLLSPSFFSQLMTFQQEEGGFSSFFLSQPHQPDVQGTFLFVSLLKKYHQVIPRPTDIAALLNRQILNNGGFFVALTVAHPSALNSSLSLQIQDLLGAPLSTVDRSILQEMARSLLQDISGSKGTNAEGLFYTVALGKELGVDTSSIAPCIRQQAILFIEDLGENQPLTQEQLNAAYYFSLLGTFNQTAAQKLFTNILLMRANSGGFAVDGVATLETTRKVVSIIVHSSPAELTPDQSQSIIAWILQHQSASGGFTEIGETTIASSYSAIEVLLLLGERSFSTTFTTWLRSLEDAQGGMVMQVGSENGPDFFATYEALVMAQQLNIIL